VLIELGAYELAMSEKLNHTSRSRLRALLKANSRISATLVEELMASDDREDQAEAMS
jgi:hypothetical protein